jgi:3-deoxy-D-manno-octulosonic-acid transferase
MGIGYEIGIRSYKTAIYAASFFNSKAKLWVKGRIDTFKFLEKNISADDKIIWIHAASLGEFEQGRPIIEAIKEKHKEYKILLSFFSPSGYEIRENYDLADIICYLPIDTAKNAKQFVDIVKPKKVFFIKYEFWKNYLKTLYENKIPVYLVSGIFRKEQLFFKTSGKKYRKLFDYFEHFFIQNQKSGDLLRSIGIENFTVCGDTRFDRVIDIAKSSENFYEIAKFAENSKVIVAGSSWEKDEEFLIKYINENKNIKLIIAPHEIKEANLNRIETNIKELVLRYSRIKEYNPQDFSVLIIDNIGMLSALYKYGQVAYIGGGFGAGIHNILEAAVYGMPVLFGPKYQKFDEAKELIKLGGAFSINDYQEFKTKMDLLFSDKKVLENISEISKNFVANSAGAVDTIMEFCF